MERNFNKKIILEDGSEYYGYGFGADCSKVTEIVFNTSMVGYQEIISDPSYTYQAVVMTYPLIGNYGMADDDYETKPLPLEDWLYENTTISPQISEVQRPLGR